MRTELTEKYMSANLDFQITLSVQLLCIYLYLVTLYRTFICFKIEGPHLNMVVQPFLICHSSRHGWRIQTSDIFIVEKVSGVSATPMEFYKQIVTIFADPNTWILDLCSATGWLQLTYVCMYTPIHKKVHINE